MVSISCTVTCKLLRYSATKETIYHLNLKCLNSDGSPVTWLSWVNWRDYVDPPRAGRDGNCAAMLRHQDEHIDWHRSQDWRDFNCNSSSFMDKMKSLICQKGECFFTRREVILLIISLCKIKVYEETRSVKSYILNLH